MTSILCTLMGSSKDVYLCFIPLFHMYGFNTFVCGLMAIGATVVILPKFTMEGMLMAIQRYRVTHLPAVPAIAIRLSKLPHVDQKYDVSSLKEVIVGGASMGREQISVVLYAKDNDEWIRNACRTFHGSKLRSCTSCAFTSI